VLDHTVFFSSLSAPDVRRRQEIPSVFLLVFVLFVVLETPEIEDEVKMGRIR
jgi:hypothetical protein